MNHSFSGILVRYLLKKKDGTAVVAEAQSATGTAVTTEVETADSKDAAPAPLPLHLHAARKDELHVNLWETGQGHFSPFLDIGVMVGMRADVEAVVVDLPWLLDEKHVSDLGSRLNGEKSVAAIFNEVVHYDGFAEGNFANISFRKDGLDHKPFSLLRLNSNSFNIERTYWSEGGSCSRLVVKLPEMNEDTVKNEDRRKSAYIRFRIRNIPPSVYSVKFNQKDRALISSTNETRIIDFRINVLRGVPEELISTNVPLSFPKFERIHCFLTTLRDEECASVTNHYKGYRSLMDEDVWNEYIRLDSSVAISDSNNVRNYLGYQWTASAGKEPGAYAKDLVVLGRFTKLRSNYWSIARFIFLVILFGAAGSGIWDIGTACAFVDHPSETVDCSRKYSLLATYIICGVVIIGAMPFLRYLWNSVRPKLAAWLEELTR
ncbi:hypothetical protein [Pseudomonas alloputida]|uniref:hypothetical protein n=1 Tax=Pseudomonas TaxID=286 RepID=UPI003EEF2A3E